MVDVIGDSRRRFLEEQTLDKGAMTLVDIDRASEIYAKMPPAQEVPAGRVVMMAGLLLWAGVFIGKVRDDQLGDVFRRDMQSIGVDFFTPATTEGPRTGSCLVLITPDAQRTMCTNLGAASNLTPKDIDKDIIQAAKVVYMEGYLFDPPDAQDAFVEAADLAHDAGQKVSITLSDPFCVDRHRHAFQMLVADHTDILFGNEEEIKSLYQVDDFDAALQQVRGHCEIACLTRSSKGRNSVGDDVHIIDLCSRSGRRHHRRWRPPAAGFYGYTQGMDLEMRRDRDPDRH